MKSQHLTKRKVKIFSIKLKRLFGKELSIKEYQPFKVKYKENKAKYILQPKHGSWGA
jgi:hypothetical protein